MLIKKLILILFFLTLGSCMTTSPDNKYSSLLEEMFQEVVIKKQAKLQKKYYHPEFKLYANGLIQEYKEYVKLHEDIYKTDIQYKVDIQKETVIDGPSGVSMRVFITLFKANEQPREIEVILIATFKDNLIYRIWELTYPDWTKINTFKDHLK